MSTAEALVLDFGNVLVEIDFDRAFEAWASAAALPASRIAERFPRDAAYCAHECGELDDHGYFEHLRRVLEIDISDADFLEGWNAILGEPLPGIGEVLSRLASRFPLYVFSNTNPAHLAQFAARYQPLLSYFRRTITSCDIGARKPQPEAFVRMAALTGAPPSRLAFFDDLEENVAGARRAGLQAFRVTRPAEILAISESLAPVRKAG
ncbi:MAG TPA: HAD family phosphatase [Burkholderiales bacterium]